MCADLKKQPQRVELNIPEACLYRVSASKTRTIQHKTIFPVQFGDGRFLRGTVMRNGISTLRSSF